MTINTTDIKAGMPLGVADAEILRKHIEAQAARIAEQKEYYESVIRDGSKRIAEQQAVIDQRNGECDRLINELAALREQEIAAYRYRFTKPELVDEEGNHWVGDWKYFNAEDSECVNRSPGYEVQKLFTQAAPVAVPDELERIIRQFQHQADHISDWHHIDEHSCKVDRRDLITVLEYLRLNSGSKPHGFVVTLPLVDKPMDGTGYANAAGQNDYRKIAVAAIRAAGGEIAE